MPVKSNKSPAQGTFFPLSKPFLVCAMWLKFRILFQTGDGGNGTEVEPSC